MPFREKLLEQILSQPSAPFRERHVLKVVQATLSQAGVPYFLDEIGNVIIGAAHLADYKRKLATASKEPLRVLIAHTDHPGFHGARWQSDDELEFDWHGGSPTQDLVGADVWLSDASGEVIQGQVLSAEMVKSGRAIKRGVLRLGVAGQEGNWSKRRATSLYGGFGFRAPFWRDGDIYYTKAADDLVGSFSVVSVALDLWKAKGPKALKRRQNFLGFLTRAEEVGYIGAIAHFEKGYLQRARRPIVCVSLETSRTLPGAEIGKGPVVRLGDRTTVFGSGPLRVLTEVAKKALPDKHQRRIMDGGTCEGTAATAYGLPSVGISIPLGNYHNQNFEGGPDARASLGPAPEFVHAQDIDGMITLCHALLEPGLPWGDAWGGLRKEFKKELRGYARLLKEI